MLKMALFDCAINENCCSVDGGRGICPLFASPPWGIWQLNSHHPREFAIQGKKKCLCPGFSRAEGLGTDGIDRCIKPTTVYVTVTAFHAPGYRASGYQILEQVWNRVEKITDFGLK